MQVNINPQQETEDYALELLYRRDANPDVGMGYSPRTAVGWALEFFTKKYGEEFISHVDIELASKNVHSRKYPGYWVR